MRFKQVVPQHVIRKNRQYDHSAMFNAYDAVKRGLSVRRASKVFNLPEQTLRDRVIGLVDPECVTTGRTPALSLDEEAKLVGHLQVMAKYGYGYTRQEVADIATDYAVQLGKRSVDKPFTLSWFKKFVKRWPEIHVVKPRPLEKARAKATSEGTVSAYFDELTKIIKKYNLEEKAHLIFNVDEKGITQCHSPPYVVSGSDTTPPAVTSGKGKTTTVIGCGSAAGVAIPPYFVFAGKRLMPELMKEATPGAAASMSDSGWSNSEVFRRYLTEHFIKFIPNRDAGEQLLLLFDGHKSHISVDLLEWASQNKITLFVLPAHTSHLLQPLDVACYGPFQKMYNNSCHKHMRENAMPVSRYDICSLVCRVYTRALSPENLRASFQRTGIFPLNRQAISKDSLIPSQVFLNETSETSSEEINGQEVLDQSSEFQSPSQMLSNRVRRMLNVKQAAQKEKSIRKSIAPIVSGKAITEEETEQQIISHKNLASKTNLPTKKQQQPVPGTSGVQTNNRLNHGIPVETESESEFYDSDDTETCCVCGKYTPDELKRNPCIIFTNWAKCDKNGCEHWVHLRFCTNVRAVRRGDKFFCPHCSSEE